MSDFHLLRPEWLWALLPLLLTLIFQRRQKALSGQWKNIIAPQLQAYLLKKTAHSSSNNSLFMGGLWLAAILTIVALSGPSWQKQPSLVYSSQGGLVIALDLSLSMTSQDLSPSRLQRAKYKITDILKQTEQDNIALIAYAGDAHVASPLTRDVKTILNMLPVLSPYIMPTPGSNLVSLVQEASALFEQGKSSPRKLLLVTDGVEPQDIETVSQLLKKAQIELSILAVGTEQGAPIVKPDGHFFKDSQGQVILPVLEWDNLQQLSDASGARITKISNDDSDINYLVTDHSLQKTFEEEKETLEFDQWLDSGYWLILPILLLSLTAFRRGILLIAVVAIMGTPQESWADNELPDFLLNKNQLAHKQFETDPKQAAQLFADQQWKASSLYKAKDYQGALDIWQQYSDAQSLYNAGNALAQLQRLDDAIGNYEQAMELDSKLQDAETNKAIVEALKKQQEQQQKQDAEPTDKEQSDQESSDQEQSDQQQSQGDKQSKEQKEQQSSQQSQDDSGQDGEESSGDNPTKQGQQKDAQNPKAQQQTDEEKQKQQAAEAQQAKQDDEQAEDEEPGSAQAMAKSTQQLEKEQAMQQWIERIPDDPGGLLRNKFLYQYNKRNQQNSNQNGDRKPW